MATDIETQNNELTRHLTVEEKHIVADSEWANLRRVPDKLPKIALLILAVEASNFTVKKWNATNNMVAR
jgi:POT family proton-dependent oligopeptide transporter